MFDGIIEIIRDDDHVIVMTGVEDEKLLHLKGTYPILRILQCFHNIVVIFLPACYDMQDLVTLTMIVLEL